MLVWARGRGPPALRAVLVPERGRGGALRVLLVNERESWAALPSRRKAGGGGDGCERWRLAVESRACQLTCPFQEPTTGGAGVDSACMQGGLISPQRTRAWVCGSSYRAPAAFIRQEALAIGIPRQRETGRHTRVAANAPTRGCTHRRRRTARATETPHGRHSLVVSALRLTSCR